MGQKINQKPSGVGIINDEYLIPVAHPGTGKVYKVPISEFFGNVVVGTPNLQEVTDAGNETTLQIITTNSFRARLGSNDVAVLSNSAGIGIMQVSEVGTSKYFKISPSSVEIGVDNGFKVAITPAFIAGNINLTLPQASGQLALKSQIPTNNNQLTNGANYATVAQLNAAVLSATNRPAFEIAVGSGSGITSHPEFTYGASGLIVDNNAAFIGELNFEQYPNGRNDGTSLNFLYTDSSGNLQSGLWANQLPNSGNYIWNVNSLAVRQTANMVIDGVVAAVITMSPAHYIATFAAGVWNYRGQLYYDTTSGAIRLQNNSTGSYLDLLSSGGASFNGLFTSNKFRVVVADTATASYDLLVRHQATGDVMKIASSAFVTAESDPTVPSWVKAITATNITNWNSAYSWGNHGSAGYELSANKGVANGYVPLNAQTKIDPAYLPGYVDDVLEFANLAAFPATGESGVIYVAANNSKVYRWTGSAYVELSTYTETDPIFTSHAAYGITAQLITNWNNAYAWGNHAVAGYLTQTSGDTRYYTKTQLQTAGQASVHWNNITNVPSLAIPTLQEVLSAGDTADLNIILQNPSVLQVWHLSNSDGNVIVDETGDFLIWANLFETRLSGTSTANRRIFFPDRDGTLVTGSELHSVAFTGDYNELENLPTIPGNYWLLFGTGIRYNGNNVMINRTTDGGQRLQVGGTSLLDGAVQVNGTITTLSHGSSANWNTAYGWGNHATAGYLTALPAHTHDDRYYTETEVQNFFNGTTVISGYNRSNWDAAYTWGNHASAGYLTSFTEADPTVASHVKAISTTNISNWNSAYGWGNHANAGYLTSFTETDPTVPSHVKSITTTNISNWSSAFGWGNHAGLYRPISYVPDYSDLTNRPWSLASGLIASLNSANVVVGHTAMHNPGGYNANIVVRNPEHSRIAVRADSANPSTAIMSCDYLERVFFGSETNSAVHILVGNTIQATFSTSGDVSFATVRDNSTAHSLIVRSSSTGYFEKIPSTTYLPTSSIVGTTGYIALFSGTNGVGNSVMYQTGSNILIGSTSDNGHKLQINGSVSVPTQTGYLSVGYYGKISETGGGLAMVFGCGVRASVSQNNYIQLVDGGNSQFIRMRYDTGVSFHTGLTGSAGENFADTTNERMLIDLSGNVFIKALDTDNTPPTTTGTTKRVIVDAAGKLSFEGSRAVKVLQSISTDASNAATSADTNLHSMDITATEFAANGDVVEFVSQGIMSGSSGVQLAAYVAGTQLFRFTFSSGFTTGNGWEVRIRVMRFSSTELKVYCHYLAVEGNIEQYNLIGSLSFSSGTINIKTVGLGASAGAITAKLSNAVLYPAP